jgi:hypothetical protein
VTFADLRPGDVFLMSWWLTSGPTPRAYMVVSREAVLPFDRDFVLEILRLEAADEKPSSIHQSMLEEAQEKGEIRLLEILPR